MLGPLKHRPPKYGVRRFPTFNQSYLIDSHFIYLDDGTRVHTAGSTADLTVIKASEPKVPYNLGYECWSNIIYKATGVETPSDGNRYMTVQDCAFVAAPWFNPNPKRYLCPSFSCAAGLRFDNAINLFMPPIIQSGDHAALNKATVAYNGDQMWFGSTVESPFWVTTSAPYTSIEGGNTQFLISIQDLLTYNAAYIKTKIDDGTITQFPTNITAVAMRASWTNDDPVDTGKGDGSWQKSWFYPAGMDHVDSPAYKHSAYAVIPCLVNHMDYWDWMYYGDTTVWDYGVDAEWFKAGQWLHTGYIYESTKPIVGCTPASSSPDPTLARTTYWVYNGTGSDIDMASNSMWITGFDPTKTHYSSYGAYTVSISDAAAAAWDRDSASFAPVQTVPGSGTYIGGCLMKLLDQNSRTIDYAYLQSATGALGLKDGQFFNSNAVGDRSLWSQLAKFRNADFNSTSAGYVTGWNAANNAWNVSKTIPKNAVVHFLS